MKDNCIVAQSGGPTVAINASLAGVIAVSYTHLDVYKRQHMPLSMKLVYSSICPPIYH